MKWLLMLGHLIPKNLVSFSIGWLSRLKLPPPFAKILNNSFVKIFGIQLDESGMHIDEFLCIEDIFTRPMASGQRPITAPVCSPADGTLFFSSPIEKGLAIQAKGLHYGVEELVYGSTQTLASPLAWYSTIYLAPHNYHRVHSPMAGQLRKIRYFPGELWPVNPPFLRYIPRIFTRNERLVFEIQAGCGGLCHVVMVGALNVGRISSPYIDFMTNDLTKSTGKDVLEIEKGQHTAVNPGDELGTFMLGSTVVLVFDKQLADTIQILPVTRSCPIRLGQSLLMQGG